MKVILTLSAFILSISLYAGDPKKVELDSNDLVIEYTSTNGDTTSVHRVYEVDNNLVIIDSVKVEYERIKPVVKEVEKYAPDPVRKYIGILALIFAVLAVLNAKRNNKKNEPKN